MASDQLDYAAAVDYLYSQINYERTAESRPYPFRLQRMQELIDRLQLSGIAGHSVPLVHIAGTKGKGSTATMVASMLTACGLRTGLYTSPHLRALEERFLVDGQPPSRAQVVDLIATVRAAADQCGGSGKPTFFELTTALALLRFQQADCQAVVLEVGLGGRLDSTNVCHPAVTAITSIGLDHQHLLGDTLAEIAAQKAGIIKPGIPLISGVRSGPAAEVIQRMAAEQAAPLWQLGRDLDVSWRAGEAGRGGWIDLQVAKPPLNARQHWQLQLDGAHQAENAAVALGIVDALADAGWPLPLGGQARGLAAARCPGRIEHFRLPSGAELIVDTAHNAESIAALCDYLQQSRTPGQQLTVIFGTSRDKDHQPMLQRLCPLADRMILTQYVGNPRYRDPAELLSSLPAGYAAELAPTPAEAICLADTASLATAASGSAATDKQPRGNQRIVVCGSFFLAAEVLPLVTSAQAAT